MKCPECGDDRAQQLLVKFLCVNHHCENFDEDFAKNAGISKVKDKTKKPGKSPNIYFEAASAASTTTSWTDFRVAGLCPYSIPADGKYSIDFITSVENNRPNTGIYVSIYADGKRIPVSEITCMFTNICTVPVFSRVVADLSKDQVITIRWRVSAGTGTMYGRNLTIMKVGNK